MLRLWKKDIRGRLQKLVGTWKTRYMTVRSHSSGAFSGLFRVWMTIYSLIHNWLYGLFDCLFSPSASEISEIVHCLVSSCGWDGPMLWNSTKDLVFFFLAWSGSCYSSDLWSGRNFASDHVGTILATLPFYCNKGCAASEIILLLITLLLLQGLFYVGGILNCPGL